MEGLKEECGIVAAYQMGGAVARNVAPLVVRALVELQNRGQLSAGLTSYNPKRDRILQTHKEVGTVHEVFRLNNRQRSRKLLDDYAGVAAIGHNRYATSGSEESSLAQPFERVHGRMWKWFAFAFNGNLANYDELKSALEAVGYHITYHTDTEVMMHHINKELQGETLPDFTKVFANLSEEFDGAYNIVFLNAAGDMVAMRDPLGIKPLCYAVHDDLLVVASESIVLTNLGMDDYRTLHPGELLIANAGGYRVERYVPERKRAYCFFEWVYFSNLASNLEGRSVYKVRQAIGEQLAGLENPAKVQDHLVIAVPETAKAVANAFGYHLGLPVVDGLLRNRYVGRTFIDGANRLDAVRMKFTPMREVIEDRKVFLVDDTLVRGTTLQTVIHDLRERGRAREIHVRIGNPPIMGPCFYGIDMPTVSELFAPAFLDGRPQPELPQPVLDEMARSLGADSLKFLPVERLVQALGIPADSLCKACIDTRYPTAAGQQRYEQALRAFRSPQPNRVATLSR